MVKIIRELKASDLLFNMESRVHRDWEKSEIELPRLAHDTVQREVFIWGHPAPNIAEESKLYYMRRALAQDRGDYYFRVLSKLIYSHNDKFKPVLFHLSAAKKEAVRWKFFYPEEYRFRIREGTEADIMMRFTNLLMIAAQIMQVVERKPDGEITITSVG